MQNTVEILAPAGDKACLDAALAAGADAVYFGLDSGFNARARATNFDVSSLSAVMNKIHDQGRRGYVTFNTLVFDQELPKLQELVIAAAEAGVDAAIVQDFGVARLIRRLVPTLRLHASTQMTCTDLSSIELAAQFGMDRITLPRELALKEIRELAKLASVELEVFVHGALCVSYSGQCLTSEAIGGRSANRGACAQACRLPFDLVVNGLVRDLGDVAYLLSPKDLDASRVMPDLVSTGIAAIKIEGRLKSAAYVAATTRLYRLALAAAQGAGHKPTQFDQELSAQSFSRGVSLGFLRGVDHQALVNGTNCDHVGVRVGTCLGTSSAGGHKWLRLRINGRLALGDGILVQGMRAGTSELGGRIWKLRVSDRAVELADKSDDLWVWLGPDRDVVGDFTGRRVFRTSSASLAAEIKRVSATPVGKVHVHAQLTGRLGERPCLTFATTDNRQADVLLDHPIELAVTTPLDHAIISDKLARLGNTPYQLDELSVQIPDGTTLPLSSLNRARRAAVEQLTAAAQRHHLHEPVVPVESLLVWPTRTPLEGGLFVTCRSLGQALAALSAGASGIYLDFLAITGLGPAVRELRSRGAGNVGIALPRIRKPGEEKIDAYVMGLQPDTVLVRSLGSFASLTSVSDHNRTDHAENRPFLIADYSLNVTNTLSALEVLNRPVDSFTPSFDLDATQLRALIESPLGPYAEVVVHHPMPLFHMEHCVIVALLSAGHDHRDCGRPCDRHVVSLRDRKGVHLPVEADIGCRNTVFHGVAQSAADQVPLLRDAGVKRFRVELVRETAAQTHALVVAYRDLLANRCSPQDLCHRLDPLGLAIARGTLRVVG